MSLEEKFKAFLDEAGLKEGGCAVYQDSLERYYLVNKPKSDGGDCVDYAINDRLFYDYGFIWQEYGPWTLLYKKIE